tara:strand:- start:386 stop:610 length:225 start_codon:yes stop_codon:yes gene_type:complete
MKGGDYMEEFGNFLELAVIFFLFIMSWCGAAGGLMLCHMIFKEWKKSWLTEDMDEDDVLDLYDEKINLKNRRKK